MNACPSCGATMSEGETFCPQCGAAIAAAATPPGRWRRAMTAGWLALVHKSYGSAKPTGAWRRAMTGAIGLPLVGAGVLFFLAAIAIIDDELGRALLGGLGVMLLILGTPFIIATYLPFGRFRRVMVGVGAALFGWAGLAIFGGGLGLVGLLEGDAIWSNAFIALAVAASLFYLGYRIAR